MASNSLKNHTGKNVCNNCTGTSILIDPADMIIKGTIN
ncbi:hypothetical protein D1BOALGB6SA_2438 [Olavius sp. associated proteobacterium Delta 1]|nr:hypothetical protein D1BOALGB6SA_2438 [Olavius sp. associated proteobacterium Delta 1]